MGQLGIRDHRGMRAFSLIELVVVVSVIGVLSAMAVPRFSSFSNRHRLDAAAMRISADLERARDNAARTGISETVMFSVGSNDYELSSVIDLDHVASVLRVSLGKEPYGVNLIVADFGGSSKVIFDMYGMANSDGVVTIELGGTKQSIMVTALTGEASVQ